MIPVDAPQQFAHSESALAGKPRQAILADPRDVPTRHDNNEINGCVAEVAGWDGALRCLEEQARVRYAEPVHDSLTCDARGRIESQGDRQMIKLALTCDSCGSIIAWGKGANELRHKAQALYRMHRGKDLCLICGVHVPLSEPQEAPGRAPVDPLKVSDRAVRSPDLK